MRESRERHLLYLGLCAALIPVLLLRDFTPSNELRYLSIADEALRSALASTRMEGFDVTEQTEKDCIRLMNGEVSVADLVKEILARPAKAV